MKIEAIGTGNFAAEDNTSFVMDADRRYLVDCPKNYKAIPELESINDIILTHLHPDHYGDLGTLILFKNEFYKQKINIYTTKEIYEGLKQVLDATINYRIELETLKIHKLPIEHYLNFVELTFDEPVKIGELEFILRKNIHSAPTFGFTASHNGKKLFYSSDTRYDPKHIKNLFEKGIITEEYLDKLLNFGWDADLIIHEADNNDTLVHTPVKALESLPKTIKSRLYLAHFPEKLHTSLRKLKGGETYEV